MVAGHVFDENSLIDYPEQNRQADPEWAPAVQ